MKREEIREALAAASTRAGETAQPRFLGDELRDGIIAVLPDECYVTRSGLRCTAMIGGTFDNGATWVAEMCCLPCRIRAVLESVYPPEQPPEGGDA